VTHTERILGSAAALIGGIVFAFCLGLLQQLITNDTGPNRRLEEKLRSAKKKELGVATKET
jgi:hypothetical protein